MSGKNKKHKSTDQVNADRLPEHIRDIVEAINEEDLRSVLQIISHFKGEDFNIDYIDGASPLIHAVNTNDEEIVNAILSIEDIDTNTTDAYNRTALNIAIKNKNTEIADLLLDCGARINKQSKAIKNDDDNLFDKTRHYLEYYKKRKQIDLKKIELSTTAVSACSVLYTLARGVSKKKGGSLNQLPLELTLLIAGFLVGNLPASKVNPARELLELKGCKFNSFKRGQDNYPLMFLYNFNMDSFDFRKMPFFSFFMHEKINIIDMRLMKLNMRLAFKLIAGIDDAVLKNEDEQDLEFSSKFNTLFPSFTKLGLT